MDRRSILMRLALGWAVGAALVALNWAQRAALEERLAEVELRLSSCLDRCVSVECDSEAGACWACGEESCSMFSAEVLYEDGEGPR